MPEESVPWLADLDGCLRRNPRRARSRSHRCSLHPWWPAHVAQLDSRGGSDAHRHSVCEVPRLVAPQWGHSARGPRCDSTRRTGAGRAAGLPRRPGARQGEGRRPWLVGARRSWTARPPSALRRPSTHLRSRVCRRLSPASRPHRGAVPRCTVVLRHGRRRPAAALVALLGRQRRGAVQRSRERTCNPWRRQLGWSGLRRRSSAVRLRERQSRSRLHQRPVAGLGARSERARRDLRAPQGRPKARVRRRVVEGPPDEDPGAMGAVPRRTERARSCAHLRRWSAAAGHIACGVATRASISIV